MRVVQKSIISPVRPNLNKYLFKSDGEFLQKVRLTILKEVKKIIKELNLDVKYIWLIGSNVTYQYDKDSDVDINISIKNKFSREEIRDLNIKLNKMFNGKIKFGGTYPLNFHIINTPFNLNFSEAIYDVYKNRWIKKPNKLTDAEITSLIKSCLNNEVLEDVINQYLKLEELCEKYVYMKDKSKIYKVFTSQIETFIDSYEAMKEKRRSLNIKGSKTPVTRDCVAVINKLAESFGIGEIYKKLKEIQDIV